MKDPAEIIRRIPTQNRTESYAELRFEDNGKSQERNQKERRDVIGQERVNA